MIALDRPCPVEGHITTPEAVIRSRIDAFLEDVPAALPGTVPRSRRQ